MKDVLIRLTDEELECIEIDAAKNKRSRKSQIEYILSMYVLKLKCNDRDTTTER